MDEVLVIPDDLESCQRLLRELLSVQVELTETCESLRDRQEKLEQENEELQLTIKDLLRQLYGRRSERFVEGRGQQHFDFGDEPFLGDPSIVSAAQQDPIIQEFVVRRRQGVRQRERKAAGSSGTSHGTHRADIARGNPARRLCPDRRRRGGDSGVRARELWVRRIEYPKYKLPASAPSPSVATGPLADADAVVDAEPVVDAEAVAEAGSAHPALLAVEAEASRTCGAHRRARSRCSTEQ